MDSTIGISSRWDNVVLADRFFAQIDDYSIVYGQHRYYAGEYKETIKSEFFFSSKYIICRVPI